MYIKTQGIVLKKTNFEEADKLLTVYTPDIGKLTCIAKGVRRPKSKKAGHIELGNWCQLMVAKGKNLDILIEAQTKKSFGMEDFSERKANKIYHLLELVDTLTVANNKNRQVFMLLLSFLKRASDGDSFEILSVVFKVKILSALGFFSGASLKNSKAKEFIEILENEKVADILTKVNLPQSAYLKLSTFLDSMIEKVTENKIKTARFIYG